MASCASDRPVVFVHDLEGLSIRLIVAARSIGSVMGELKTKEDDASITEFIDQVPDYKTKRQDSTSS